MSDEIPKGNLTQDELNFFSALHEVYKKFDSAEVGIMTMLRYHSTMLGNLIGAMPEKSRGDAFAFAGTQVASAAKEAIKPDNLFGMPIVGRA